MQVALNTQNTLIAHTPLSHTPSLTHTHPHSHTRLLAVVSRIQIYTKFVAYPKGADFNFASAAAAVSVAVVVAVVVFAVATESTRAFLFFNA